MTVTKVGDKVNWLGFSQISWHNLRGERQAETCGRGLDQAALLDDSKSLSENVSPFGD